MPYADDVSVLWTIQMWSIELFVDPTLGYTPDTTCKHFMCSAVTRQAASRTPLSGRYQGLNGSHTLCGWLRRDGSSPLHKHNCSTWHCTVPYSWLESSQEALGSAGTLCPLPPPQGALTKHLVQHKGFWTPVVQQTNNPFVGEQSTTPTGQLRSRRHKLAAAAAQPSAGAACAAEPGHFDHRSVAHDPNRISPGLAGR